MAKKQPKGTFAQGIIATAAQTRQRRQTSALSQIASAFKNRLDARAQRIYDLETEIQESTDLAPNSTTSTIVEKKESFVQIANNLEQLLLDQKALEEDLDFLAGQFEKSFGIKYERPQIYEMSFVEDDEVAE